MYFLDEAVFFCEGEESFPVFDVAEKVCCCFTCTDITNCYSVNDCVLYGIFSFGVVSELRNEFFWIVRIDEVIKAICGLLREFCYCVDAFLSSATTCLHVAFLLEFGEFVQC